MFDTKSLKLQVILILEKEIFMKNWDILTHYYVYASPKILTCVLLNKLRCHAPISNFQPIT